jgi:uncharacterized protein YkwD
MADRVDDASLGVSARASLMLARRAGSRRLLMKVLLVVVAVVLLVGCGGGSSDIGEPGLTATPSEVVAVAPEAVSGPEPQVSPEPEVISAPEPVPETGLELTEAEYFALTLNAFRGARQLCGSTEYGPVGSVVWDARLARSTEKHAADMAENNFFSHTGSDGLQFWDRAIAEEYPMWGGAENIAAGNAAFEAAFLQWVNSPGHCANLMRTASAFGLGYAFSQDSDWGHYWTFVIAD